MRRFQTFCAGWVCLMLLFLTGARCEAREVPPRDPLWLGEATLVALVRPVSPDVFAVEKVEWDENQPPIAVGDSLILPKFQLFNYQEYGPMIAVEPMTPDTRIWLYLKRDAKGQWVVEGRGYAFFWSEKPNEIETLRKQARQAIAMRNDWRRARDTPEVRARVRAIYPFLEKYGRRFNGAAQLALQKTGAVGGDFLAGKLATMNPKIRGTILSHLAPYRSEKLHRALLRHLATQQRKYETYLARSGPREIERINDWNSTPPATQEIYGELYSGLEGLADFNDRRDLPTIRHLGRWSAKYHFNQVSETALHIFRDRPEPANLPVIAAIWKDFSARPRRHDLDFLADDVVSSLRAHHFWQTVAVLAPFLNYKDRETARQAHLALILIVGSDRGKTPQAWLGRKP